eukprot:PhM_4_TR8002/c0_g1_i1/m.97596
MSQQPDETWSNWKSGVYYTRVACQNAVTLTFDIMDGQGCLGEGPEGVAVHRHRDRPSMEAVLNRDVLGDFVQCNTCGGIFPANSNHNHDDVDDIIHHRTSEYKTTPIENAACMFGCAFCLCTSMLSWCPYCILSCVNTSRRRKDKETAEKEL